ncbi:hypothetical protein [Marinitoga lauensis]|uniref:hypothetical protein n=1 Tax=Marinitoga lauensis TaxID=2201189 RepID=UPI001404E90B|nr:hypothetical protein [Marinitoga lauensis]
MAENMNLNPGDTLNIFYTDGENKVRLKNIKITGIFHSGIYIIDSSFIVKKKRWNI